MNATREHWSASWWSHIVLYEGDAVVKSGESAGETIAGDREGG